MAVTLCPIALAVGCRKCPIFKVCPVKGIIGDQRRSAPARHKARSPRASHRTPHLRLGRQAGGVCGLCIPGRQVQAERADATGVVLRLRKEDAVCCTWETDESTSQSTS